MKIFRKLFKGRPVVRFREPTPSLDNSGRDGHEVEARGCNYIRAIKAHYIEMFMKVVSSIIALSDLNFDHFGLPSKKYLFGDAISETFGSGDIFPKYLLPHYLPSDFYST